MKHLIKDCMGVKSYSNFRSQIIIKLLLDAHILLTDTPNFVSIGIKVPRALLLTAHHRINFEHIYCYRKSLLSVC